MAYMSKTKRKRVMKQRLLVLAVVIAVCVAVIIAVWQIGLGSTLAKINDISIRSGNVKSVDAFLEYIQLGQFTSDSTATLTGSAKTQAEDDELLAQNYMLNSVFIPLEVMRSHFVAEGRVFPNDEETAQMKEAIDYVFSTPATVDLLSAHGVKRAHAEYYYEYSAAMTALQNEVLEKNPVSEEDAQKFYDENPSYFTTPFSMQASHILITDADHTPEKRAEIEAILEKANSGEDFAELAKEYSEDSSAENGGDLGSFGLGQMVAPFEEAALALEPGEISDIVETEYGYHIIKLTSKTEESVQPFDDEEVQSTIEYYIGSERTQAELDRLVGEATIEYFGLINPTTGKPPVSQTELDEARGLGGSSADGGNVANGSSADSGSAANGSSTDSGSAANDGSSAVASDDDNTATPTEGDASADGGSSAAPGSNSAPAP